MRVPGQPGLRSELQASPRYRVRLYLKTKTDTRRKNNSKIHTKQNPIKLAATFRMGSGI